MTPRRQSTEAVGGTIGAVAVGRAMTGEQLRCFLVEPAYRGIGLGSKLMSLYMEFFRATGYARCYLWTTHELTAADGGQRARADGAPLP